jgi:hypothetical protein
MNSDAITKCVYVGAQGRLCSKAGRGFEGHCIKHQNFKRIDDAEYRHRLEMESEEDKTMREQRWVNTRRYNAERLRSAETGFYLEALESQAENFGYLLRGLAMMADPFNNTALPEDVRHVTNNLESIAFHIGAYTEYADPPEDPRSIGDILWSLGIYPEGRLSKLYVRQFVKKTLNCIRYVLTTHCPQRAWWLRLLTLTRHLRDMEKLWEHDLIVENDDEIFPGDTEEEPLAAHPAGSINLSSFVNDSQNVHTSPARDSTERALSILMKRPGFTLSDQNDSVTTHFLNTTKDIGFTFAQRSQIMDELVADGLRIIAFNYAYSDVFLRVWDKVMTVNTTDILRRLAEELYDGAGMCAQGKMTRLVNVLRGFDEELDEVPLISQGELLQTAMARISALPVEEREPAMTTAFTELGVSLGDQDVWRSAVMEA